MDTIKGLIGLTLIIILTVNLWGVMAWYYAILLSIFLVVVLPSFIKGFWWDEKFGKLRPLPDIADMPDEILSSYGVTDWEIGFIRDMKKKLKDETFVEKITRKQCVKLIEVYLERVRKVKRKEYDMENFKITIGDRVIQ